MSDTHVLIQLQQHMQELMPTQLKPQEMLNRKEDEKQSPVKLSKLEMISFSGDKTRRNEFWDCFQSAVHINKMLSDIEKIAYLKGKLY